LNVALTEARRMRADLFVYNLSTQGQVQSFTVNDDTVVNMEVSFRSAILYGLCGHALLRDQEDVQDARATTFMDNFMMGLTGRSIFTGVSGGSGPGGGR
jgi:hypothetical protein